MMTICHDPLRCTIHCQVIITWQCVVHRFQVKRLRSPSLFEVFAVCTTWLPPYLTDPLQMWYTHKLWGDDVSHTIFRSKGQRPKLKRSLKVLPCSLSGCPYLTDSLHIRNTHNPWGDDVSYAISRSKGQGQKRHSEFLPCLFVAQSLFDRFTSNVAHIQPMRGWCVMHHFHVKRSKVKLTQVVHM